MRHILLATVVATTFAASPAAAVTVSNMATGGNIGTFGPNNSPTYGQVFTAPITGTLTSFTLSLNNAVGELRGGVGTWNGSASYGTGFGSPTELFASAPVSSGGPGSYTFTPNVSVTAGSLYVAYLTVFGVANASGFATMPLGDEPAGLHYFVWNNTTDAANNASWNYFADFGNALFSATFAASAVPVPAAMALFGAGLLGLALARRRA